MPIASVESTSGGLFGLALISLLIKSRGKGIYINNREQGRKYEKPNKEEEIKPK